MTRRLQLGPPPKTGRADFDRFMMDLVRQLNDASVEASTPLPRYTLTNAAGDLRTLDVSSASAAEVAQFLATLAADVQSKFG